ncbi:MAG: SDR family oxidoreductase [Chlamydiia bacterium]|nr:SDR family oxidoreductase [Chlamydiia bacterium]
MKEKKILITGASGYIGGRLLEAIKDKYFLRVLVRSEKKFPDAEVFVGDVLKPQSIKGLFDGIDTAFYLIHSMESSGDFVEKDRKAAKNFAKGAQEAGVRRVIYLGGLGVKHEELSSHLKSRQEVGEILRQNAKGVQVIEFRASIIIGAGSLSYEMIRALVERLPVMITPKWVWTKAQPIYIRDVIDYLSEAIEKQIDGNMVFEIGGKDPVSYGDIMREYAKQKGLTRYMIHVPVLSPRLSSLWLGLITPVYAKVGRKLVDSATNETCVKNPLALKVFAVKPKSLHEAIKLAIEGEKKHLPRWSDSDSFMSFKKASPDFVLSDRLFDVREALVKAPKEKVFQAIQEIGGDRGYYYGNFLWQIRGFLDLLVGGAGFRRGRRSPTALEEGDVVDFWRVEAIDPGVKLRLRAEMKVPGSAWLEFKIKEEGDKVRIRQEAAFDPDGIWGKLYWYSLYPVHQFVFKGMLKGICRYIEKEKS